MPRKQPLLHCRALPENSARQGHCSGATGRSVRHVAEATGKTTVKGRLTQKQMDFYDSYIKKVLAEEGPEGAYRVSRELHADKMRAKQHAKDLQAKRRKQAKKTKKV